MRLINFFTIVVVMLVLSSCTGKAQTTKSLATELDSVSYALGLNMANQIKGNFDDMDKDLFIQGFSNGVDSTNILIDSKDITLLLNNFFRKKQEQKQEEEFAGVKNAGEAFLAENKSKDGVMTTESGLQYMVIKEGNGQKPVPTSKVKIHYHGTSIDGTVFDSSVDKGAPIELVANQFVPGFTEGLLLMNVGSKYKVFIPYGLGYGASPRPGGPIKPYEALVFEIELLDIVE